MELSTSGNNVVYFTIDEEDYEKVKNHNWYSNVHRGHYIYTVIGSKTDNSRSTLYLHRLLVNATKGTYVDHINGNVLDNSKANLRECSNGENCQNLHKDRANNSSGYRGVSFHKAYGRWEAYYWNNYKKVLVGFFSTAEEANKAVIKHRATHMPYSQDARLSKQDSTQTKQAA